MRIIRILLVGLFALCSNALLFAKSSHKQNKDEIANRETNAVSPSLRAETSLTKDQVEAYNSLKKEIDKAYNQAINEDQSEEKGYWIKQHRLYKNIWVQITTLQAKMNQAGQTLEDIMVERDKSYRMATLQVLRPTVASFVQNWNGLIRQLEKDGLKVTMPPLDAAIWVWDESPVIKSMVLSHVRNQ